MSILVANIGTSDICVKIGNHYFPIGFDREERNLQFPEPGSLEAELWKNRTTRIREMAQVELEMDLSDLQDNYLPSFRFITRALLTAYQQDPETWHPRIQPSRIWGVIKTSLEANPPVRQIHLVVTDQPETETKGYSLDTIHAFEIIQQWMCLELPHLFTGQNPALILQSEQVTFRAIAEDQLFDYYYHLFQPFDRNEPVFISVRGGTPQMQNALRVQAIAADFKTQIFLEPKLDIARLLHGEPSVCSRIAYWRYQQTQKYQAVEKLLNRWDFDGAVTLLQDWRDTLQSLQEAGIEDDDHLLQQQQSNIERVLLALKAAVDCFNLDHVSALKRIQQANQAGYSFPFQLTLENYNLPKALYAQCLIYYKLRQVAHFLARLGSFYEVTQIQLIAQLENDSPPSSNRSNIEKGNRYVKRRYIDTLIASIPDSSTFSEADLSYWLKLDFWYGVRNDITHGSKGVSLERIREIYENRYEERPNEQRQELDAACSYTEILSVMAEILTLIGSDTDEKHDDQQADDYYIYSMIRDWSIAQLKSGD